MKCICQMCACGKHRCPHFLPQRQAAVTSKEPCKVLTEYKGEFQKTNGEPIVLHRPDDCIKPEGTVDFDTTHKNTYSAHKIELSPRKKKAEVKYERSMEPMDCGTEYGQNYLKGSADVPRPASYLKKKTRPYGCGEGDLDTSVTQQDYAAKPMIEKATIKKLRDNHVPSDAPFETKSVQRADYTKFNERPSKTGRRPDNLTTKGEPRYFDTTTKSHYVPYEHKQEIQKTPRQVYEPSTEPFEVNSVMRADYGAHVDPIKSAPVKHDNLLFATDEPMQNKTTNLAAYPHWGVQKSCNSTKEVATYRPPSKDMDLQKTSDDYKNFGPPKPSKSLRPKTNITFGGDFYGVSMYTNKFVKHDVTPRPKPIVSREQTHYSSGVPFEGCSESKDHYKKHLSSPAKMIRRVNEVFDKSVAFDGNTSYKEEFKSKKLPSCPVIDNIKTNFNGYNVIDDDGHRFLEKVNSSQSNTSSMKISPLPPIGESNANLVSVN